MAFPNTRISDRNNRALELETTAGGVRKAVSGEGSITGFGADIIIVDDCMKADDARSAAIRLAVGNISRIGRWRRSNASGTW